MVDFLPEERRARRDEGGRPSWTRSASYRDSFGRDGWDDWGGWDGFIRIGGEGFIGLYLGGAGVDVEDDDEAGGLEDEEPDEEDDNGVRGGGRLSGESLGE